MNKLFINGVIVEVEKIRYEYDLSYDRLQILDEDSYKTNTHVLCPECLNNTFTLKYGQYEIIAICKCGHEMTVYDG